MRIHHLTVEAVGPFPGRHEVDLDHLSAGGLFLLEGPTGSGKSTLIDAIIFGLYGSLGSPAQDDRLPSAHAVGTEPVIEVVFSTGAGIFRVRRTPAYDRPKRRGSGTTRQNATAKLWRLESTTDMVGEPLAAGAQEVGTEVRRIVVLDRTQFSQTVVLPQGRFSTFLRAKPDERAAVLQDVFGTEIYQRVQDQLTEMAREVKRRLAATRQEVATAVASLVSLLAEDDDACAPLTEAAAALDAPELLRLTEEVVDRVRGEHAAAEEAQTQAREAEREAQRAWDAERELDRLLRRRRELLAERDRLVAAEPQVDRSRERLAAARRGAAVAGTLRTHSTARTAADEAKSALEEICAEAGTGPDGDLSDLETLEELRAVIDDLTGEKGALLALRELEEGLEARGRSLEQDEAALAEQRAAVDAQREALAARPARRADLESALDRIQRAALSVPAAEAAAAACRKVRDAARDVETGRRALAEADAAVAKAAARAATAADEEHRLRRRWIAGMAGSLAAELEPGEPCAVCGGTEHPAPAPRSPEHATVAEVDAAGEARKHADAALTAAREAQAKAAERLAAREEEAGGTDLAAAQEALDAAERDLLDAKQAEHLVELRKAELTAFDEETRQLEQRLAGDESSVATTAERLRGLRVQLNADRERCTTAARDAGSVAGRVRRLESRLGVAQRIVRAREAHRDAHRRLTEATAALEEALRESGFDDAGQAAAAALPPAEVSELEQRVNNHDAATTLVREALAEEAVAALTGDEVADVAAAQRVHDEHHAALTAANSRAGRTADAVARCERASATVTTVLESHRRAAEDAAPVLRMGELASAGEGNARATTLSTFVLLRRFEDVVAAANERLTVMSDGRYSLLRTDEREGRSRKAGLGLTVQDHVTETCRDPHTLSGGETFYVSLCLALGLADVVTSEAGGISLDTLFIDEGFGSLDPHTLDGVLGELNRLQAGGRAVGIVSHVSELKDRIADRIAVSRLPSGASTLTVRA